MDISIALESGGQTQLTLCSVEPSGASALEWRRKETRLKPGLYILSVANRHGHIFPTDTFENSRGHIWRSPSTEAREETHLEGESPLS